MSEICCVEVPRRRLASLALVALVAAAIGVSVPLSVGAANSPVSVTVTAAPNPVNSGSELTYTIVVTNTGGASLKDIVLVDQVNAMTGIDNTNNLLLSTTAGSAFGVCCAKAVTASVASAAAVPRIAAPRINVVFMSVAPLSA